MSNKNFVIITARTSSSRLINKILLNITKEYKSIDILILRAKKIGLPIILATTNKKQDDELVKYVKKKYDIKIFRGSSQNKIKRWSDCFDKFKINLACMIDGDDLSFDYNIYKKAIKSFDEKKTDLIKNEKNIITGVFTYVLSYNSLCKSKNSYKYNTNTEMAFKFFNKSKIREQIYRVDKNLKNKKIRLTLDYFEDLILFKLIYSHFSVTARTSAIVNFLDKFRFLNTINYDRELLWAENIIKTSK